VGQSEGGAAWGEGMGQPGGVGQQGVGGASMGSANVSCIPKCSVYNLNPLA